MRCRRARRARRPARRPSDVDHTAPFSRSSAQSPSSYERSSTASPVCARAIDLRARGAHPRIVPPTSCRWCPSWSGHERARDTALEVAQAVGDLGCRCSSTERLERPWTVVLSSRRAGRSCQRRIDASELARTTGLRARRAGRAVLVRARRALIAFNVTCGRATSKSRRHRGEGARAGRVVPGVRALGWSFRRGVSCR